MADIVACLAWYTPESWRAVRAISIDAENLCDSHEAWLKKANDLAAIQTAEGRTLVKINIEAEALRRYAAASGLNVDAKTRAQFAMAVYAAENGNEK
jgi:hypothetical protein